MDQDTNQTPDNPVSNQTNNQIGGLNNQSSQSNQQSPAQYPNQYFNQKDNQSLNNPNYQPGFSQQYVNQNQAYPQQNIQNPNDDWLDQFQPPPQEEIVLTWSAPNRPFRPRNRKYYTTVGSIVILISLILGFAGQFLPIAVVISVGFLAYVLSAVPPTQAEFKLSSYGIRVDQTLYNWESMGRQWIETVANHEVLYIETLQFPYRLTLVLQPSNKNNILEIVNQILPQEKPPLTTFERAAKWLQERFPLE